MRALLILSLAVFTGCSSNPTKGEEPNPPLEYLKGLFWSYIAHATHGTDEKAEIGEKTQHGQKDRITHNTDQHATTIKNQMDSLAEEWMANFAKEANVLKELLEQDLKTLKDQLESYADNVKSQVQERVEELKSAMAPYADSLDSESLKATLHQRSEELRESVKQSVKDLRAQLKP